MTRHTTEHTTPEIPGIQVAYEPENYGVTSWVVRRGGKLLARYAWEGLAKKFARRYMMQMG